MSFENDFKGKTVLVTGGARGIGRGVALALNKLGAKVIVIARSPETLKALQDECPAIQTVAVDLSDWNATKEALEKIETVDMLVNNAGLCLPGNILDTEEEFLDNLYAVNLKSRIRVSQIVAKKMIADKRPGSIVMVSASAGMKPLPLMASYSILYAGIDQLTKILSIELGPHNIRVNAVNPGPVRTELFDRFRNQEVNEEQMRLVDKYNSRVSLPKKTADIDEVVRPILFLLSDASAMITGTLTPIEGGYTVS